MKLICFLLLLVAGMSLARADDHRDVPAFSAASVTGATDLCGLYVFRSPTNANNTVFILTLSPWAGGSGGGPETFDPDARYQLKIDTDGDLSEDLTIEATFGSPEASGMQPALVRRYRALLGGLVLTRGNSRVNLPLAGGGQFRAAQQDDPFFFDEVGLNQLLNGGAFPRPGGVATNRFGPNANVLAIVIEVPSNTIGGNTTVIRVWGRVERGGEQIDRAGRPLVAKMMIPPIPRGSNFPINGQSQNRVERRPAFNLGLPRNDLRDFRGDMISVLQNFFGRTSSDANTLSGLFLPDVLSFELGNPNGFGTFIGGGSVFGNGRRLRDDTADILLNILTNGAIPTDNVPDDNGTRITDGNLGTVAAFPYIGSPNPSPAAAPTFP